MAKRKKGKIKRRLVLAESYNPISLDRYFFFSVNQKCFQKVSFGLKEPSVSCAHTHMHTLTHTSNLTEIGHFGENVFCHILPQKLELRTHLFCSSITILRCIY